MLILLNKNNIFRVILQFDSVCFNNSIPCNFIFLCGKYYGFLCSVCNFSCRTDFELTET